MPIFEFKCQDCEREFEDLSSFEDKDNARACPSCGKPNIIRKISLFSTSSGIDPKKDTVYSPKEIDKVVGKESEKGWESYADRASKAHKQRQQARRAGEGVKEIVIPKGPDGTVRPFQHLGDSKERNFRKTYTQEYKKQISDTGKEKAQPPVKMKVDL